MLKVFISRYTYMYAHSVFNSQEFHDAGLHILAELSSITIELFKKSAELILLQDVSCIHCYVHTVCTCTYMYVCHSSLI